MKKIYLMFTAFLFASQICEAQLTLTKSANSPVVGDSYVKMRYDSTTAIPRQTGSGQTWNFTTFSATTSSDILTYTSVASTPMSSLMPGANIVLQNGATGLEFYKTETTADKYIGFMNLSNSSVTFFNSQPVWNVWPTSYGTTSTNTFSATETSPTYTNTWAGGFHINASGSGTVIMPNGNKHTNCLQVVKTVTFVSTGTQTYTMAILNYEYWSSNTKFPIVIVELVTNSSGTVVTKNYELRINQSALTVGMDEKLKENKPLSIYPNPARDLVNVEIPGNVIANEIQVIDITGKVVARNTKSNSINVNDLPKGLYYLKVYFSNTIKVKQLIISE